MRLSVNVKAFKEFVNSYTIFCKGIEYPINSKKRDSELLYARYVCFNFLRENGLTFDHIGRLFTKAGRNGCLDHSTVMNGVKQYDLMFDNKMYSEFNYMRIELEKEFYKFIIVDHEKDKLNYSSMAELESLIFNSSNRGLIKIKSLVISKHSKPC